MALALDTNIAFPAGGTTSDATTGTRTWTHTPVGTPRGVLVLIVIAAAATDVVTGATYGGVAMARVRAHIDAAGEPGGAWAYFLGSGVPTGAQTVGVTRTGTNPMTCQSTTFTASNNTDVVASSGIAGDGPNPQASLDSGTAEAIRLGAVYSGLAAPSNLTPITTGGGVIGGNHIFVDHGNTCGRTDGWGLQSGNVSVGWTAASDDAAYVVLAVREIPSPSDPPVSRNRIRNGLVMRGRR